MGDTNSAEGWQRVCAAVMARIDPSDLGYSLTRLYEDTGISEGTYRKMRDGVGLTYGHKRRSLCDGLGWTPDSIDRILAGGEPVLIEGWEPPVRRGTIEEQVAQIRAELNELTALVKQLGNQRRK